MTRHRPASLIKCGTHGDRSAAIVCCDMLTTQTGALGFVDNSGDTEDWHAGCDVCQTMFLEEGARTERFSAFNDFKVAFDFCYASLKQQHGKAVTTRSGVATPQHASERLFAQGS